MEGVALPSVPGSAPVGSSLQPLSENWSPRAEPHLPCKEPLNPNSELP